MVYLAYWDAGSFIVDVSNPDSPSFVGWVPGLTPQEIAADETTVQVAELPGNHHFVTVNADATLLAVGKEAWDQEQTDRVGGPGGVELWDISDPTQPAKRSTIEAPSGQRPGFSLPETTAHNCDIHGDRLYTSWYNGGVKIHDIEDPENPTELVWWRTPEQTSFWTAQYATEEAFVASSITIGGRSERSALFTFPNEPGTQENPPPLGGTTTPQPDDETPTGTPSTTTPTPGTSTQATTSPGSETVIPSPSSPVVSTPGFGISAGITALSLAGWRLLTRSRDD